MENKTAHKLKKDNAGYLQQELAKAGIEVTREANELYYKNCLFIVGIGNIMVHPEYNQDTCEGFHIQTNNYSEMVLYLATCCKLLDKDYPLGNECQTSLLIYVLQVFLKGSVFVKKGDVLWDAHSKNNISRVWREYVVSVINEQIYGKNTSRPWSKGYYCTAMKYLSLYELIYMIEGFNEKIALGQEIVGEHFTLTPE